MFNVQNHKSCCLHGGKDEIWELSHGTERSIQSGSKVTEDGNTINKHDVLYNVCLL